MRSTREHVHRGFGSVRPYLHGSADLPTFLEKTFDAVVLERNEGGPTLLQIGDSCSGSRPATSCQHRSLGGIGLRLRRGCGSRLRPCRRARGQEHRRAGGQAVPGTSGRLRRSERQHMVGVTVPRRTCRCAGVKSTRVGRPRQRVYSLAETAKPTKARSAGVPARRTRAHRRASNQRRRRVAGMEPGSRHLLLDSPAGGLNNSARRTIA